VSDRTLRSAVIRGPEKYNQGLSERRVEVAKEYLISQGVPADKIETQAKGKDDQLPAEEVQTLQSQDSQAPPQWMTANPKSTWLAYNRRIDVILEPVGQESTKTYPNYATDASILWQRPMPTLQAVETATQMTSSTEQVQAADPNE
jgi:hypothetical protein